MRVTRHTTFLMLVICVVAVPATFLLPVFYGPAFADATTQLLILLPGVFLVSIQSVLVQYFGGTGLPVAIPIFWSVCFAANLALNLTLVPTFGARAAALSSTISYALIFVMVTTLFRLQTAGKLSQTFMLKGPEFRELLTLARPGALWR
jgi:O-antigen/teichoic acid export membrane protein